MEKTKLFDTVPSVDAEYEAIIDHYLTEMERMKAEMDERQTRIEQMRAETEVMLAELKIARA